MTGLSLHAQCELLRDKLLELAGECETCNGTRVVTVSRTRRGRGVDTEEPCYDCADIHDVLDKTTLKE